MNVTADEYVFDEYEDFNIEYILLINAALSMISLAFGLYVGFSLVGYWFENEFLEASTRFNFGLFVALVGVEICIYLIKKSRELKDNFLISAQSGAFLLNIYAFQVAISIYFLTGLQITGPLHSDSYGLLGFLTEVLTEDLLAAFFSLVSIVSLAGLFYNKNAYVDGGISIENFAVTLVYSSLILVATYVLAAVIVQIVMAILYVLLVIVLIAAVFSWLSGGG